jgi:ribosomal protein S18 acetylase RimI-like enzyme
VGAAEDWLRERGCPKVELMVRDDNPEVTDFYEALGYVPDAVQVLGRRL